MLVHHRHWPTGRLACAFGAFGIVCSSLLTGCSLDNGGADPVDASTTAPDGAAAGASGGVSGNGGSAGKTGGAGKGGSGGTAGDGSKPDKDASAPDKDGSTPDPTDSGPLDAGVDAYVEPPPTPPAPPRLEAHLAGGGTGTSAHYVLYHSVGAPRPTNSLNPRGQSASANYRLNTGLAAALPLSP